MIYHIPILWHLKRNSLTETQVPEGVQESRRTCLSVRLFWGYIRLAVCRVIVPLKYIEYGFGYITIRSPYTPYSIELRGTIYRDHGAATRLAGYCNPNPLISPAAPCGIL